MSVNRRRLLTVVMVLSLGLNLLVIGGITARILYASNSRPIPPNLFWVLGELDEATRDRLRPTITQYNEELRPLRIKLFQAQRQVNALLSQDALDLPLTEEALASLRDIGVEYQQLSHQQTLALFEQLTPEQRIAAMRFIQERSRPPRERDRDDLDSAADGR